jgi:hypothetical protein
MDREALLASVRELRANGATPKGVAKALGLKRAEADALIREVATEAAPAERALIGCWISPGWSQGLSWPDGKDWSEVDPVALEREDLEEDEEDEEGAETLPGLASVVVAREHRYDRISVCSYLVDAQCLGVKNAIGPFVIYRRELESTLARLLHMYDAPPLPISLELARELVFGAEDYARDLGFTPHRDFEACRAHLGAWQGPSAIVFGYNGQPFFVPGPEDDVVAIEATLERWAAKKRLGSG